MGLKYDATEWRFLLAHPAVFLHNGNSFFFIYPYRGFSTNERNSQQRGSFAVTVNYQEHNWLSCGDLVVRLVQDLQGGYKKYPCFMCLWDSRADDVHYVRQEWLLRQRLKPGSHIVHSHPLVEPNKILLPPLHIKLWVMKNFVKVMDREGSGFAFLQEKFPKISIEKFKADIFDGPQIRKLTKDPIFDEVRKEQELSAWQLQKLVVTNFRGNHRIREGIWRPTEEFSPTRGTFGQFSKELWKFVWRAGEFISPRHSHYGRALPRPVECKLFCWLLLVLETGWGACWTQEEVPEKTFHLSIDSFVYFSFYYSTMSFLIIYQL